MPEETAIFRMTQIRRGQSQAKVPWLSEWVQSLRFRSVAPREEVKNERRLFKKVDVRKSPSMNHLVKDLGWKRPSDSV